VSDTLVASDLFSGLPFLSGIGERVFTIFFACTFGFSLTTGIEGSCTFAGAGGGGTGFGSYFTGAGGFGITFITG